MDSKLSSAKENNAHFICVACPYSFLQFDVFQSNLKERQPDWEVIGAVLYPQLLGLSMGFAPDKLGLHQHNTKY